MKPANKYIVLEPTKGPSHKTYSVNHMSDYPDEPTHGIVRETGPKAKLFKPGTNVVYQSGVPLKWFDSYHKETIVLQEDDVIMFGEQDQDLRPANDFILCKVEPDEKLEEDKSLHKLTVFDTPPDSELGGLFPKGTVCYCYLNAYMDLKINNEQYCLLHSDNIIFTE